MFRLARWLKRRGGVPIVVLPREGDIVDWYAEEGIDVYVIPFVEMHRRWSLPYLVRYLTSTVGLIIGLVTLIKRLHVDIVHVNEIIYWPGLIAGKIAGAGTICHVRVILERPMWVQCALTCIARCFSDQILCVSDAVRAKMFSSETRNVQTLYNPGPDLDRFDPQTVGDGADIRQELGIPTDAFVVGLVSKFIPDKGHLALIETAHLIEECGQGDDIVYVLVGGKMPGHEAYHAQVRQRLEQYALLESFVLTGTRSDVPRLIAACDVMVHLPTNEDPLPGVVFEAMVMEKPIVAFASGGVPEQFENGKSGMLVEKNDVETLVENLLTLARDRPLRLKMGKEARRFLTSRFSSTKFFSELRSIYLDTLR